ncbi:MAG TPA: glycosyltransferase family 4 protein [Polyangiaceae bacterium]|jgi:glycosyltransferase involved in cell wall biosynthesis|nr:glycosyltransferase family 4 protein [Polyangiaceae bacterium]
MPTELFFVFPAGSEFASGGNVYNRELVRALCSLGRGAEGEALVVEVLDPAEFVRRITRGAPGLFFVDTLNLEQARVLERKTGRQRAVLMVHHLPSLEPGIKPEDPELGLERAVLPLFDGFVATSPFTADLLARRGFARDRILTVEPGLPAIELGPPRLESPVRGLLVANLIRRKGVLELLDALSAAAHASDAFELEIVGRADLDVDYAITVANRITTTSALSGRVRWRAPVGYGAMGAYYRAASLLISAAGMETFGMALAEARAHGLPILALDAGHAAEHVTEGDNGLIFKSIPALAAGFLALARDTAALRALVTSARRTAAPGPETWARAASTLLGALALSAIERNVT